VGEEQKATLWKKYSKQRMPSKRLSGTTISGLMKGRYLGGKHGLTNLSGGGWERGTLTLLQNQVSLLTAGGGRGGNWRGQKSQKPNRPMVGRLYNGTAWKKKERKKKPKEGVGEKKKKSEYGITRGTHLNMGGNSKNGAVRRGGDVEGVVVRGAGGEAC